MSGSLQDSVETGIRFVVKDIYCKPDLFTHSDFRKNCILCYE